MIAADSIRVLESRRVRLDLGLTAEELAAIERRFGFEFSLDHREFLSLALPCGDGWVEWRGSDRIIDESLRRPTEGILFDVEHNAFWPPSLGVAPADRTARLRRASDQVATWPTLIPLFGHRYMPAAPAGPNAPVFSVWQSDVIVYGRDLLDYVRHEFGEGWTAHPSDGIDSRSCPPWPLLAYGLDDEI